MQRKGKRTEIQTNINILNDERRFAILIFFSMWHWRIGHWALCIQNGSGNRLKQLQKQCYRMFFMEKKNKKKNFVHHCQYILYRLPLAHHTTNQCLLSFVKLICNFFFWINDCIMSYEITDYHKKSKYANE